MIEESTVWYLGTVGDGTSYKLAKYLDTNMVDFTRFTETKIGLLRVGELMAGQFSYSNDNSSYWLLTFRGGYVRTTYFAGNGSSDFTTVLNGIKPSLNLKSNVIITGGLGTKEQPFELSVQ